MALQLQLSACALTGCVWSAVSNEQKGARTKAQQVEAEEEARLALLTQQAGIKLTLTPQVPAVFLVVLVIQYLHAELK